MAQTFFQREQSYLRIQDLSFFRFMTAAIVLLWICQILLPAWRILPVIYGQAAVPLHYNIHFGVDSIGQWWRIFTVPAVGLLFIIGNGFSARMLWPREPMLAYVIVSATLLMETLLFVSIVFIVLLNIKYG